MFLRKNNFSPMDVGVVLSTLISAAEQYMAIAQVNKDMPDIAKTMEQRASTLLDVANRFERDILPEFAPV